MEDNGLSFKAASQLWSPTPAHQPLSPQAGRGERFCRRHCHWLTEPCKVEFHKAQSDLPSSPAKVAPQFILRGKLNKGLTLMEAVVLNTSV